MSEIVDAVLDEEPKIACDMCAGQIDMEALRERSDLLASLRAGDIFHAAVPAGAQLICLVTEIGEHEIRARHLMLQEDITFDRQSGVIRLEDGHPGRAVIDSVEPLPIKVHNVFLSLDRRYRLGRRFDRVKLQRNEIDAIMFCGKHFQTHRIDGVGDKT